MIKKIYIFLVCFFAMFIFTIPSYAASNSIQYEYFSDGSYIKSEIIDSNSSISTFSSTVSKTKVNTYYGSSGIKQWSVSVTGTFTYGNGSASCTSSSCKTEVYNNAWSVGSRKASKSGNKATASATGELYSGGHIINTITKSVTLTCSATGQFS